MKRRFLTLFLAGILVLGAVGGTASAEENGSGEKAQISALTLDFSGNALGGTNTDQVIACLEDYTDTQVEWTFGLSDAYDDKMTLMLASGSDTPMIVTVQNMNTQIINYAKAGAFWDLSEFINEEDYPNLAQAKEEVSEYVTIDGKLIGVYRARTMGRYGLGYRTDWAEKLGYTENPQTVDEVYQMMYDFTYGDPDGDGVDNTYGMELCSYMGPLDVMQTWFGVGNGWYEDESGQLLPVHMSGEYMEALNWFKKCYDDGLWASDWATRETGTWGNDIKNGLAGMLCDTVGNSRKIWDYFADNNIASVADPSQTAAMTLNPSIGKTAGEKHNYSNAGYGGFFVITKDGAKTEEDVKNCLHFLDKMCDDEMLMLATYGLEGVHWERDENGYYVDIRQDADLEAQDYAGLDQMLAYVPNLEVPERYIKFDIAESKKKEKEINADNMQYVVTNPALSLLIQSETYTLNGANLNTILDDARTNYIIGAIDEAGLQAQWDLWYQSGGEKVIEEVNTARNN